MAVAASSDADIPMGVCSASCALWQPSGTLRALVALSMQPLQGSGEFFGRERLRDVLGKDCLLTENIHDAVVVEV